MRQRSRPLAFGGVVLFGLGCGGGVDIGGRLPDCGVTDAVESEAQEAAAPVATGDSDANGYDVAVDALEVGPTETASDATVDALADGPSPPPDGPPATCFDRRKDGDESDVDCGGSCAACGPHKLCYGDFDCSATASGCDTANGGCFCQYITHQCVYNHCFDGKVSADETAVDCGGSVCPACGYGLACRQGSDCSSMACDRVLLTCVLNLCMNRRLDGKESDVDCGGPVCDPCGVGKMCASNLDCQVGHLCGATHLCL